MNFVSKTISILTGECAAQKLKNIAVLVYGHVYIIYGHIKNPKKNHRFFMTLAWAWPFNINVLFTVILQRRYS